MTVLLWILFTAIFNGNGHTISRLHIDRSADDVGLFGLSAGTLEASYYYVGAAVTMGGSPVAPNMTCARSASFLSSLHATTWGSEVDVDGKDTTRDDRYVPWDFRTDYEYPMLRPYYTYKSGVSWTDFGEQVHPPVVSFDTEAALVEESTTNVVKTVPVTMYNVPTAVIISGRAGLDDSSTSTNVIDFIFPSGGVFLNFEGEVLYRHL